MLRPAFAERARAPFSAFCRRLLGATPEALAIRGALAILCVSTFLFVRTVSRHGAFFGDDIDGFWWARRLPSGLHRLGCMAFVVVALLGYVEYRSSSRVRWLFTATLAAAVAAHADSRRRSPAPSECSESQPSEKDAPASCKRTRLTIRSAPLC